MTSMNTVSFGAVTPKHPRFQAGVASSVAPAGPATPTAAEDMLGAMDKMSAANRPLPSSVKFGGVFLPGSDKSYGVDVPEMYPLTPALATNVREGLQLRGLLKRQAGDKSTLKLFLNVLASAVYPGQDRTALADSMALLPEKTDVVVKSHTTVDGQLTLQSATGKRFMYPNASLSMGPLEAFYGQGKNADLQIRNELFAEYVFDLQTKLVERAGISSREEALKLLDSARNYNSMQALAAGDKGLVDGILLPGQRVVTREDLDTFLEKQRKSKNWTDKDVENFLAVSGNLAKLPSRPLAEASPESVPKIDNESISKLPNTYVSLKDRVEKAKKEAKEAQEKAMGEMQQAAMGGKPGAMLDIGGVAAISIPFDEDVTVEELLELLDNTFEQLGMDVTDEAKLQQAEELLEKFEAQRAAYEKESAKQAEEAQKEKDKVKLYIPQPDGGVAILDELPLVRQPLPISLPGQTFLEAPGKLRAESYLDDDVIHFQDGFNSITDNQIEKSLWELASKKQQQDNPSHIKIVINSPGGSVLSARKLRDTIRLIEEQNDKVKVDVLVAGGMAASAGSWLLSSATGNRLTTPNARLMVHQAGTVIVHDTPSNGMADAKDLKQTTQEYAAVVAEATGRKPEAVEKDFEKDVWTNSVESLFYGPKGLTDGIMVGPNQVITRQDVYDYMVENVDKLDLGGDKVRGWDKKSAEDKVDHFINARLRSYRQARDPETFSADNPFDNVLKTVAEVSKRSARLMTEDPRFQRSMPSVESDSMDMVSVSPISPLQKLMMMGGEEDSAAIQLPTHQGKQSLKGWPTTER